MDIERQIDASATEDIDVGIAIHDSHPLGKPLVVGKYEVVVQQQEVRRFDKFQGAISPLGDSRVIGKHEGLDPCQRHRHPAVVDHQHGQIGIAPADTADQALDGIGSLPITVATLELLVAVRRSSPPSCGRLKASTARCAASSKARIASYAGRATTRMGPWTRCS